jgi:hypothetical protein
MEDVNSILQIPRTYFTYLRLKASPQPNQEIQAVQQSLDGLLMALFFYLSLQAKMPLHRA